MKYLYSTHSTIRRFLLDGMQENGAKIELQTENGESNALSTAMIRSHSVAGDLHGVQPDPIAADILRKEPEQESFTTLDIFPIGMISFSILRSTVYLECLPSSQKVVPYILM